MQDPTKLYEEQLQISCVDLLNIWKAQGLLRFAHVPNGEERHPAVAAKLQAMGVSPGFPDLIILFPATAGHAALTIFVELKSPTGTLKGNQIDWRDWLEPGGFAWALVRSLDQLKTLLDPHLSRVRSQRPGLAVTRQKRERQSGRIVPAGRT